jgi:peroxiredoxin
MGMKSRYAFAAAALASILVLSYAQTGPTLSDNEKAISDQMGHLRSLPDEEWVKAVARLAVQIQQLPSDQGRRVLISQFGNLVTEGDAGQETLQVVASTMAEMLRNSPNSSIAQTLAQLVRYEHVQVSLDNPNYRAAMEKLADSDRLRSNVDFTISDLKGMQWSLKELRGKVVLVNFWATWCPPCRREMPDMEALYQRFASRGLVILAISDEPADKVQAFIAGRNFSYPILLDPGGKVQQLFDIQGIPKSFVYDRDGKLVAQAIDRRTERQFLAMLKEAGLE